jgi:acyl carrier protein
MTREEIEKRLIELAAEQAGVNAADITSGTHFRNDLNFDSLDEVEYAMSVEDEFGLSVPDERAQKLQTIADVTNLVMELADKPTEQAGA